MGMCASSRDKSGHGIDEKHATNDRTNNHNVIRIEDEEKAIQRKRLMKLLLLGAGESGKSTILKQIKILHNNGFEASELAHRTMLVYSNTVRGMATMLTAMKSLKLTLSTLELESHVRTVLDAVEKKEDEQAFSRDMLTALKLLWTDAGVLKAYERRAEYQLDDCVGYFLNNVDRIADPSFKPTFKDVLFTRAATMGIIEMKFRHKGFIFRVFDVGGQRSERRKWIHCFDDVNAVIFVASLSEFDQVLREDNLTNRMHESMRLFDMTCNSKWFNTTSMILFLNKRDLFEEKLTLKNMHCAFEDAPASQGMEENLEFVMQKYSAINLQEDRHVYVHETCATETSQVSKIIDSVIDMCISNALKSVGMN